MVSKEGSKEGSGETVLVTGGAGFIGSNIVRELLKRGYFVRVLDDFSLGRKENLPKSKQLEIVKGDIRDTKLLGKITKDVSYIFNEAAKSSAPMFNHPSDGYEVNVLGFQNVLQAAVENKVRRVIYASTSSLYSGCPCPQKEQMQVQPKTFYELTKYMNELTAFTYYRTSGLETVGLRYFSVYGYNEKGKGKYANLVSQFIWTIQKGGKPVIYGDGTQKRDFTFVEDTVEANMLAMKTSSLSGVFNVGTGIATDLNGLVKILGEVFGKEVEAEYVPNPIKNYVQAVQADTAYAERYLKFKARYSLKEGIKKMLG